jgi:hypothetical protein
MRTPNHARVAALALAAAGAPATAQDEAFQGVSQAEYAGLVSSIGHLGALVDHLREQLRKAAATMSALHGTASPVDEGRGDLDARIPDHAFRVFVDEHAALLHELAHGLSAEPDAASVPAQGAAPTAAPEATDLTILNDDLIAILGRPNFTCIRIAQALRLCGADIKSKAEDEQAAVIHFLLMRYMRHGSDWAKHADIDLRAMLDQVEAKNKAALANAQPKTGSAQ